ncbi:MAG: hypothetical protein R2856_04400 [Caldilineaceae bacterium]
MDAVDLRQSEDHRRHRRRVCGRRNRRRQQRRGHLPPGFSGSDWDTYPPVVSNLQVNGGVKEVSQQQVELSATITDDVDPENPNAVVSGPNRIYYVELHWYSGIGGHGSWIPSTGRVG